MTKKIFAMFLAVLMVVAMLPTSVFAAGCPGKGSNNHTLENCDWEKVDTTAPTCGKDGWTSYKCKTCGDLFIADQVPATGEHTWEVAPDVAPTCGKPGSTGGKKCTVCGLVVGETTVPPLHAVGTPCEWSDWAPASVNCLTGGTQTRYCLSCNAQEERKIEKKSEHNWAEPVLVTPATAEEEGLAVVACKDCGEKKSVNVFFKHTCDKLYIPQVDATCFTDGMKAHYECRVCGALYTYKSWTTPNRPEQTAALVIPAKHAWKDGKAPTCANPTAYCTVCEKDITVNVSELHNIKWSVQTPATCTTPGLKSGKCQNAGCKTPFAYDVIPALGHISMSKTVAATCGTYAYTFSYCLRTDCSSTKLNSILEDKNVYVDKDGIWYDVSIGQGPVAGVGFNLGVYQGKLGKTYYFTGNTANKDYYLETTEDASQAVEVILEQVAGKDNSYLMSFMKNGVKTYITMVKSGRYFNIKLTTEEPENYWNWNTEFQIMTMTLSGTECYIGAYSNKYNDFSTLSGSEIKFLRYAKDDIAAGEEPTSFACDYPTVDDSKLHVYDVVVHYAAGFDANNHKTVEKITKKATCQSAGEKIVYCVNHECPIDYIVTETIAQLEHNWIDATYDQCTAAGFVVPTVNGQPVTRVEPTCISAGYAYQYCSMCPVLQKNTLPALGHLHDEREELEIKTEPGSHTENGYKYWICERDDCPAVDNIVKTETFVWAGRNHTWADITEAQAAHEGMLVYDGVFLPGSCSVVGLERWICTDPHCLSGYVYTIQEIEGKDGVMYPSGEHAMPANTSVQAPTCTVDGWIATYQCAVCDAIVGNAKLGEKNMIPAHGHDYQANPNYKAPDCDAPVFGGQPKLICNICGDKVYDGTELLGRVNTANHCTDYTYVYYLCHCGKEHAYNFVGALGHVMDEVKDSRVESTCYAEGSYDEKCRACGHLVEDIVIPKVEHVNAAGEKFTDKCTDTVTDRHCVTCCKYYNHAAKGNAHDCYTADENEDEILDCLGECLIGKICHPVIDGKFPSTCEENAYTLWVCGDCKSEEVEWVNMGWNGHKPAEADKDAAGNYIKYANYIYVEYTWVSIEVVNGEFVRHEETYLAKMLDYKQPSYTEAGYWTGVCQECKMEVTQEIAKKAGLGFELITSNPVANEYTLGSLVEVIVQANSAETSIHAFNFNVAYTSGLTFVGYERMNNDFILTVTDPKVAQTSGLFVIGTANNSADGKMQEIAINAETPLVKLYFRVSDVDTFLQQQVVDAETIALGTITHEAWELDGLATKTPLYCDYSATTIKTRQFLDFNRDGYLDITDLYQAGALMTGELGFTYDVTVDLNKDGVVNGEELTMAYNFAVGNLTDVELWTMGMSDLEISLVLGDDTLHCVQCGGVIAGYEVYCPHCGRNPK